MNNVPSDKPKVLIIEDDPDGRRSVTEAVADAGFATTATATAGEGLKCFEQGAFDAVLTDLVLPDQDGMAVLQRIKQMRPTVPVIIMTAYGTVPSSVRAIQAGAYDYIQKPLDLDDIQSKVRRAIETSRLRAEVTAMEGVIRERMGRRTILAESPAMNSILDQVRTVAPTLATVLVVGESGTGKELVARALHAEGSRVRGPFVAVNCGALTETLLESELFGHERGAFTGAVSQHRGAFERASGGTLFLDEIGDAPRSVQTKLLRAIEEREIIRVGGHTPIRVDVRLVSATNHDLDEMVREGSFREDLLYRLKVVELRIPPLRERRSDIRLLADHFIAAACREHGRRIESADPAFYDALEAYDWPGNVRQLRNVIEAAVVLATEPVLRASKLSIESARKPQGEWAPPDGMPLHELEREILSHYLRRYDGNRTLAADKLGISRRTVQRKIREHNLPY
jgi:two-component system response regulator HydG